MTDGARSRRVCDELKADARRVRSMFDQALEREPWILPREAARSDFVPDLVSAIAEAAVCHPPTRPAVLEVATVAARHAAGRAAAGADHSRVVLEYYLLRNALWTWFREREARSSQNTSSILVVDLAISIATRAALLGYYRRGFEEQGRWAGALERLVDEVPVMWDQSVDGEVSTAGASDR